MFNINNGIANSFRTENAVISKNFPSDFLDFSLHTLWVCGVFNENFAVSEKSKRKNIYLK